MNYALPDTTRTSTEHPDSPHTAPTSARHHPDRGGSVRTCPNKPNTTQTSRTAPRQPGRHPDSSDSSDDDRAVRGSSSIGLPRDREAAGAAAVHLTDDRTHSALPRVTDAWIK